MGNRPHIYPSMIPGMVLVLLCIFSSVKADAIFPEPPLTPQDLFFEKFFIKDGLPSNSVMALYQDRKGFIWIGSNDGLLRYDGYEFKTYRNHPSDSTSLSYNAIWSIIEDYDGYIWVGTEEGGVNRFDPTTEIFTRYVHDPADSTSLGSGYVADIIQDSQKTIWVGTTNGGLNRFNPETGSFDRYMQDADNPRSIGGNYVSDIYEDTSGRLWVMTRGGGIQLFDRTTDSFLPLAYPGLVGAVPKVCSAIVEDSQNQLWISSMGDGLFKMDVLDTESDTIYIHLENMTGTSTIEGGNIIFRMAVDRWDRLWLATWGAGLLRFDPETSSLVQCDLSDSPTAFSNIFVHSLIVDRNGTLWAGSDWGLNKADLNRKLFWQYTFDPKLGLQGDVFRLHEAADGTLWMSSGGLVRMEGGYRPGAIQEIRVYAHDPDDEGSLPRGTIQTLLDDSEGNLWIGMRGGGLAVLDIQTHKLTRFNPDLTDPHGLAQNVVSALHRDQHGQLWVGTLGSGILRIDNWDKNGNASFTPIHFDLKEKPSEDLLRIWFIHEDDLGMFWIGTRGGLIHYHPERDEILDTFSHDPNDPGSLADNNVNHVMEDEEGYLWLSASNGGLVKFDPINKRFKSYTHNSGLINNEVTWTFQDDMGQIWVATAGGFTRFDPETETFSIFNDAQGFSSQQYNVVMQDDSGLLIFGGQEGLTIFDPENIRNNPIPPQIAFTGFSLFNEEVEIKSENTPLHKLISYTDELVLTHRQNVMTFEFAALHHTNPVLNQYSYQLSGFDDRWFNIGNKREVTFTNLDAGEYDLRIKAANSDGVWTEKAGSLHLTILAPWWKTWPALSAYTLIGLILLAFIRRYELNRQMVKRELELEKVEAQKLVELDSLKTRFFANISHEFRTPLTIVLGQLDTLLERSDDDSTAKKLSIAHRSGKRLLQLINQLLDLSKLEARKMSLKAAEHDLISFLRNISGSFESLATQKELQLEFIADQEELQIVFDPELLERVILNLISNAIKFTRVGDRITLEVKSISLASDKQGFICVEVADTGIGIPANRLEHIFNRFYQVDDSQTRDQEGTGIGLALVKELVELHHGQVSLYSQEGKGSRFEILLPDNASAFDPAELVESRLIEPPDAIEQVVVEHRSAESDSRQVEDDQDREIILIVEDNPDIRNHVKELLIENYQVVEAGDGVEGLEVARETIPDLIITDVMMPRMDGTAFAKAVRADERSSHVPIVMLTARADDEDKISGLELGVDDYLIKPFNPKELRTRVRNLLDMRAHLRKRFSKALVIKPEEVSVVPADKLFMQRLIDTIETNLGEEGFSVEKLSASMGVSVRTLSRKLKALIDQSPSNLIRSMRLHRAVELLRKQTGNMAEIAYAVGFSDQAHFTRTFRKEFNMSPSEYLKTAANSD